MIRILLSWNSDVNALDNMGRSPLYVCVSSLSTGLYKEDLKYQVPCIKVLYSAGCDMLNLVDWLKWKGPGIPMELMAEDPAFLQWYKTHMNSPHSLLNLCRKVIQQRLIQKGKLRELTKRLPVPSKFKVYLSRTMFLLPSPAPMDWGPMRVDCELWGPCQGAWSGVLCYHSWPVRGLHVTWYASNLSLLYSAQIYFVRFYLKSKHKIWMQSSLYMYLYVFLSVKKFEHILWWH